MRTTSGLLIIGKMLMDLPPELLRQKTLMENGIQEKDAEELLPHQPALDVDAQIENLKNIGLVINDEIKCKEKLGTVSYFRLVKAYGVGLKPHNGNFDGSISFDDLVSLYDFNANFRLLLLKYIEDIEITLRCRLANYFCVKYGVLGYEDPVNFNDMTKHQQFLEESYETIARNKRSPFIRNFQAKYEGHSIPFYALVEVLSFGTLSKFFKNMKNEDKKEISKLYNNKWTYLESWFEVLAYVRNICAHYGRLYDIRLDKTPKIAKSEKGDDGTSTIRIFSAVYCIAKLVPHDSEWHDFLARLENLFARYPQVELLKIGFPGNWRDLLA